MSNLYYVNKSETSGKIGAAITMFVADYDHEALKIFEAISEPYSRMWSVGEDITDTALSDDNNILAYYRDGELIDRNGDLL